MISIPVFIVPVHRLDEAMQRLAKRLSKVTRICDAGAFRHDGSPHWFIGVWRDGKTSEGSSWTLRVGRTELVIDLRAKKAA